LGSQAKAATPFTHLDSSCHFSEGFAEVIEGAHLDLDRDLESRFASALFGARPRISYRIVIAQLHDIGHSAR
jgi:hypothetical protein